MKIPFVLSLLFIIFLFTLWRQIGGGGVPSDDWKDLGFLHQFKHDLSFGRIASLVYYSNLCVCYFLTKMNLKGQQNTWD